MFPSKYLYEKKLSSASSRGNSLISFFFQNLTPKKDTDKNLKVDIDYIAEEPALDPASLQFRKVFDAFRAAQILSAQEAVQKGFNFKYEQK